jgi:Uma2 family endonuclease
VWTTLLPPAWARYNVRMSAPTLPRPTRILRRTHHRFTVDEYLRMIEVGILTKYDKVELIRGEILNKMTIGDPHAACVSRFTLHLPLRVSGRALVRIQGPIRLADSRPEPDVALVKVRDDHYLSGSPMPPDIFLVVEVADSSIDNDREEKRPLYAENGITEYWIADLNDEVVEVYRQPRPDGTYADVQTKRRGDRLDIAALPGVTLAVDEVL